jgi:hypothetical protein
MTPKESSMITRIWHGATPASKSDEYLNLMRTVAIPQPSMDGVRREATCTCWSYCRRANSGPIGLGSYPYFMRPVCKTRSCDSSSHSRSAGLTLSLPNMFPAATRDGFGRLSLDQLLFADGARFSHHVRHGLTPPARFRRATIRLESRFC